MLRWARSVEGMAGFGGLIATETGASRRAVQQYCEEAVDLGNHFVSRWPKKMV